MLYKCYSNAAQSVGRCAISRSGIQHGFSESSRALTTASQAGKLSEASEGSLDGTQRLGSWPPSSAFASYTVGLPPTGVQLRYANRYFEETSPTFLSSSPKFRTLPVSSVPEVAFLGRSNVGKSSLLNALLHRTNSKVAHVSKRPGRTKLLNAFGVGGVERIPGIHERWGGKGGVVIMDTPGYGKASQEEWGKEIVKYLTSRKQLRRTFVLIDSEHGVKETDIQLLRVLWHNFIPYQVIMSKIDKVVMPHSKTSLESLTRRLDRLPAVFEEATQKAQRLDTGRPGPPSDVITCSSEVDMPPGSGRKIGIENLRWAVLCAAGLDCDIAGNPKQFQAHALIDSGE